MPTPGCRGRSAAPPLPRRGLSCRCRWAGAPGRAVRARGRRHGAACAVQLGREVPPRPGALPAGAQPGLRLRLRGVPAGGGLGRARRGERSGPRLSGRRSRPGPAACGAIPNPQGTAAGGCPVRARGCSAAPGSGRVFVGARGPFQPSVTDCVSGYLLLLLKRVIRACPAALRRMREI